MNELDLIVSSIEDELKSNEKVYLKITTHSWGITAVNCGSMFVNTSGDVWNDRGCLKINLADPESINKLVEWIRYCRQTECGKCKLLRAWTNCNL